MNFNQNKLTKQEWDNIEIPIDKREQTILEFIIKSFTNVNNKNNSNLSLINYLKIDLTEQIESFLYFKYFHPKILILNNKYNAGISIDCIESKIKLKSADKIRVNTVNINNSELDKVFESILIEHIHKYVKYTYLSLTSQDKKTLLKCNKSKLYHLFTLSNLINNSISRVNRHIFDIVNKIINDFENSSSDEKDKVLYSIFKDSNNCIELNDKLLKYKDMELYNHQKEIFSIFNSDGFNDKQLVLYTAPTGTGKTITPLALSNKYKIIFLCAARHVGLALARCAISTGKKVAFAFGCETADDIRLHNSSAKDFVKNYKTGSIFRIDHSVGDLVEIMITDIKSFNSAMNYMCAFNDESKLLLYWDEPTITMDYDNHPLHDIIHKNWNVNRIPNIVLSSATLPKEHEIRETLLNYQIKFVDSNITTINGYDFKKTIPIINKDGYSVLPHYLSEDYGQVKQIVQHIQSNLSLLRYFDLSDMVDFCSYALDNNFVSNSYKFNRHFNRLQDLSMENIKKYYLYCLDNITLGSWGAVYMNAKINRKIKLTENNSIKRSKTMNSLSNNKPTLYSNHQGSPIQRIKSENPISNTSQNIKSNVVNITTCDAYTLTDGPTIYLANDVEKIANFLLQQSQIPSVVIDDILKRISYNDDINLKISSLENEMQLQEEKITKKNQDENVKEIKNSRKIGKINVNDNNNDISKLSNTITELRNKLKSTCLNNTYVPNKIEHLNKWCDEYSGSPFTSNIDENDVKEIMGISGISEIWKLMLLMGIGVFINQESYKHYVEIMKKYANNQKLYLIIASSDYIYGTNYQFCHAYISKDLNLTQEKIIQAIGRVGRSSIQQNYSVRFRNDNDIFMLLNNHNDKPECINMNRLFS